MSRKQKLESLAALGVLKDSDVKHIQARLKAKPPWRQAALAWVAIASLEAGAIAALLAYIWYKVLGG